MTAAQGRDPAEEADLFLGPFEDESPTAWTHETCNRSGWVGPGEPCSICEQEARSAATVHP